ALLLHSLGAPLPAARPEVLAALACVCVASILYAMVGGFGYLFALLVTPEMRALNRISVFVAFTGIAAFLIAAQALLAGRSREAAAAAGLALAIMFVALVDQVPGAFPPDRTTMERRY